MTLYVFSEYKLSKTADNVLGLLYGECRDEFGSRSGADGMANRFSRMDHVKHINEGNSGNNPDIAGSLSREIGPCNPL